MKFQSRRTMFPLCIPFVRGVERKLWNCSCFLLLTGAPAVAQLNPHLPPGSNFNLNNWKLQTLSETLAFTEIQSSQLEAGYTSSFFYSDTTDGSMVFRVQSNGGTTSGSHYPRVELRQMTNGANWKLTDPNEYYFSAQCKVTLVAAIATGITIGQVHGSETESELLKLRWVGYQAGKCYVTARFQNNDTSRAEYGVTLASGLSLGELVSYTIKMKSGMVTVTVNSNSASQTYTSTHYGTTDAYYFKAGNYYGCNSTNPVVFGEVHFYALALNSPLLAVDNPSVSSLRREMITLDQNFPNPFNPTTTIRYSLPNSGHVKLSIFDLLGREIATLVDEQQPAGQKELQWNARGISSGIYVCTLRAGTSVESRKILLTK